MNDEHDDYAERELLWRSEVRACDLRVEVESTAHVEADKMEEVCIE